MTIGPVPTAEEQTGSSGPMRPTAVVLILANLGPLYGVLFLGWKVFPIIFLFWLENLVIGVLNVFRMVLADPKNRPFWFLKLFLIPFFCIHFGLFAFVHGVFVMGLFGGMFREGAPFSGEDVMVGFIRQYKLGWAVIGLASSHFISGELCWRGGIPQSQSDETHAATVRPGCGASYYDHGGGLPRGNSAIPSHWLTIADRPENRP